MCVFRVSMNNKILTFPSEVLHIQSCNIPLPQKKYIGEVVHIPYIAFYISTRFKADFLVLSQHHIVTAGLGFDIEGLFWIENVLLCVNKLKPKIGSY